MPTKLLNLDNVEKVTLASRPNRFTIELADGRLAHLHDPGRLRELLKPGRESLVRHVDARTRKTAWDVLAVKSCSWIFINSMYHSILAEKIIPNLFGPVIRREVKFGASRLDFLLVDGRSLEVKGCTLMRGKIALFPDAPTERGTRHVRELAKHRGVLLFLVFHPMAGEIRPNCETDPKFCDAMRFAKSSCVEMKAVKIYSKLT